MGRFYSAIKLSASTMQQCFQLIFLSIKLTVKNQFQFLNDRTMHHATRISPLGVPIECVLFRTLCQQQLRLGTVAAAALFADYPCRTSATSCNFRGRTGLSLLTLLSSFPWLFAARLWKYGRAPSCCINFYPLVARSYYLKTTALYFVGSSCNQLLREDTRFKILQAGRSLCSHHTFDQNLLCGLRCVEKRKFLATLTPPC